jgi:hypothetical protein
VLERGRERDLESKRQNIVMLGLADSILNGTSFVEKLRSLLRECEDQNGDKMLHGCVASIPRFFLLNRLGAIIACDSEFYYDNLTEEFAVTGSFQRSPLR